MKKLLCLGFGTALSFAASACGDDGGGDPARVRVLHLSADAPNVDVYVNDGAAPAFANLPFLDGTVYAELDEGSYDFDVNVAGTDTTAIAIDDLALDSGKSYTAVAIDNVADISAIAIEDEVTGIPSGQIRIRIVHAGAGVGEVDVWNLPASGAPSALATDLAFGETTASITTPAGAYRVGIDVNNDATPDLTYSLPSLASGTHANVFAVNTGEAVVLVAHLQTGDPVVIEADPQIRAMHLSPDAPNVDVFVNDGATAAFADIPFLDGSAYAFLPPATYDFGVRVAGMPTSAVVLPIDDIALEAGASYTAVAYRNVANIAALALVDAVSGIPAGQARIRVVHVADGVGEVDVWNVTPGSAAAPLVQNLAFGTASGTLDVPPAAYDVGIDTNNDGTPEFVFDLPALSAGQYANIYAVLNDGTPNLVVQLPSGATVAIAPTT